VQAEIGETIEIAFVGQGNTNKSKTDAVAEHAIKLEVVKLPTAKRGFVLPPCRWVAERIFE
jgi:hypothetical protein